MIALKEKKLSRHVAIHVQQFQVSLITQHLMEQVMDRLLNLQFELLTQKDQNFELSVSQLIKYPLYRFLDQLELHLIL